MESTTYQFTLLAVLLLVGVMSSRLSSRLNMPVLLLFMGAGILLGAPRSVEFDITTAPAVEFANHIGTVAMAFILYSGGMETEWRSVKKIFAPGLLLSTVGVLLTAGIMAVLVHFLTGWSWSWSFLLGSVVSSTDAAAVFSILRSRGVGLKGNLASVLEFESGSNDPMAALLTLFMVGFLTDPDNSPWWMLAILMPLKMLIGAACGFGVGKLGCWLFNNYKLDYEGLYFVLGIAVVLFSYGLTECLYGNGFMAAYCAGLTMGNLRFNYKKSQLRFNNGLAWLMQVAMFAVLGMLVTVRDLVAIPEGGIFDAVWVKGMLLALGLMLLARPLAVFLCLIRSQFNWRERLFISWVGLRGAAPIVLATFPLAAHLVGRSEVNESAGMLFNLVFFMVIASVVIQGRTLMLLARALKLDHPFRKKNRMPLELEDTGVMSSVLQEFEVLASSPCLNRTLAELQLPERVRVMLIRRNGEFIMAGGNTQLCEHDGVLLMGDRPHLHQLAEEYFPGNEFFDE